MKISEICKDCSQQSDCCFIDNKLQHRCGVISAYKRGFEDGIGHGWHPVSELPPLDKDGNSQDVIVICGTTNLHFDLPRWSSVVGGVWGDKDVKWWCYPPKEG